MRPLLLLLFAATTVAAQPQGREAEERADPFALVRARMSERIMLLDAESSVYRMLEVPAEVGVNPDEPLRLVVMRRGEPVADWGLQDFRKVEPVDDDSGTVRERGLVENAYIATDGSCAALVRNTYDLLRQGRGGESLEFHGGSAVIWIDPSHPQGRWTLDFDEGRMVPVVYPFSGGRGLAVLSSRGAAGTGELSVFGPEGNRFVHLTGLEGPPRELRPTALDAFLGVELAFPSSAGQADQGVVVVDVLRRTHWIYGWSYGTNREPASWNLESSGVLVLSFLDREERYDRFGRRLAAGKRR